MIGSPLSHEMPFLLAGALALLLAGFGSGLACRWFARVGHPLLAIDYPISRSAHRQPVPRIGGLGMAAGVLPAALLWAALCRPASGPALGVTVALIVVFMISAWDDRRGLSVAIRLLVQIAAAALLVAAAGWTDTLIAHAGAVLLLVWGGNLYNFMDGADGLAGSMTVVGFGACAALALLAGSGCRALLSALPAAAAVGFLWHNRPPARLFLGDAGAVPLGMGAVALAFELSYRELVAPALLALVFAPFVVDASYTLARRALRRAPLWRAHTGHLYQRLLARGWSMRALWAVASLVMLAGAASAVLAHQWPVLARSMLVAWAVFWGLAIVLVESFTPRTATNGD